MAVKHDGERFGNPLIPLTLNGKGVDGSRGLSRTTSKIGVITVEDISKNVHAIILAGGSSDNPLARYRAMPAVELGQ